MLFPIEGNWKLKQGTLPPMSGTVLTIPQNKSPEDFRISNFFQDPDSLAWYQKTFSWGEKGHNGIDIICPMRTPFQAAHDGTVMFAREGSVGKITGTKLKFIYVASNEITTTYLHIDEWVVEEGQKVKRGDTIGYTGNTGDSTGPHLHFGAIINWKAVDPWPLLNKSFLGMEVDKTLLGKLYNAMLFREPDEGADGFIGYDIDFVISEILKSEERQRLEGFIKTAKEL